MCKKTFKYIEEFGMRIFMSKAIRRLVLNKNDKISWLINRYNENLVETYLGKEFQKTNYCPDEVLELKKEEVKDNPIWVLWWQGEEHAPSIVRACIKSVRENSRNHKVYVITKYNISDYIKIPYFIMDKFNKGEISRTHLSDMIRLMLLYQYGGMWIDATVFISDKIPESIFEKQFYSIKTGKTTKEPSHGRWTTFLMCSKKHNLLIYETMKYHFRFWKCHSMIVDYIMFDYIIQYVIKHNDNCQLQIDNIPLNNVDVFELRKILNEPYDYGKLELNNINTIFHKLSWKEEFKLFVNNESTVYNKLVLKNDSILEVEKKKWCS